MAKAKPGAFSLITVWKRSETGECGESLCCHGYSSFQMDGHKLSGTDWIRGMEKFRRCVDTGSHSGSVCLGEWLYKPALPPTMEECSSFSTSSPASPVTWIFDLPNNFLGVTVLVTERACRSPICSIFYYYFSYELSDILLCLWSGLFNRQKRLSFSYTQEGAECLRQEMAQSLCVQG